ncbi:hypothetical protein HDU93_006316, partial [Gonapodya sp. JEL0774]
YNAWAGMPNDGGSQVVHGVGKMGEQTIQLDLHLMAPSSDIDAIFAPKVKPKIKDSVPVPAITSTGPKGQEKVKRKAALFDGGDEREPSRKKKTATKKKERKDGVEKEPAGRSAELSGVDDSTIQRTRRSAGAWTVTDDSSPASEAIKAGKAAFVKPAKIVSRKPARNVEIVSDPSIAVSRKPKPAKPSAGADDDFGDLRGTKS